MDDGLGTHEHHHLTTVTEHDVITAFGSLVARYIPDHPAHIRATVRGRGATLSRTPCGCIVVHNPADIMTTERERFEARMTEELTHLSDIPRKGSNAYRAYLDDLLEAARRGEDVDPEQVVVAREAIELERIKAEGKAERQAEADAVAERERVEALCGPVNADLTASQARLSRKYTEALRALEELLETVERHNALVAEGAGKTGVEVVTERYTSYAVIDGTRHDFWRPQTYLLNMLHGIGKRWPLGRGTPFRMELPPPVVGGPKP